MKFPSLFKVSMNFFFILTSVRAFSNKVPKIIKPKKLPIVVEPPKDWEQTWKHIEEMRQLYPAEVDLQGAEALAYSNPIGDDNTPSFRFGTLIATMLSPQTTDPQTSKAFENIQNIISPNLLLPDRLASLTIPQIEEAIKMVNFSKRKAEYLHKASILCRDQYNNNIPSNIDELLAIQGVGPKIAYLTFSIAWKQDLGICVDTHVHRISNRLGWVNTADKKSNGPEHTRKELEQWLPKEKWSDINVLLVGFGQTICSAIQPKCNQCKLQSSCSYFLEQKQLPK